MKWSSTRRRALTLVATMAVLGSSFSASPANAAGIAAVGVVGQAGSFTTSSYGTSATLTHNPTATVIDDTNHRMFVSDGANNRVLVYNLNSDNSVATDTASYVLGQAAFGTSATGLTASTMSNPQAMTYDAKNNRLYVSDYGNQRVLVFNTSTITNGMAASYVLGQVDFVSNTTATTQTTLSSPRGVALSGDSRYLFVADQNNRRVMVWDTTTLSNGMGATYVIGQTSFTGNAYSETQSTLMFPTGVAVDPVTNMLFVAENNGPRVSAFNLASLATGMNCSYVMGQQNFTTQVSGTTQSTMAQPYSVAAGAGRVYVNEIANQRVLIFDETNTTNGQAAISVLGQPDFTSYAANNGGQTASSLSYANGVFYDSGTSHLYVSDAGNNRVLIYNAYVSSSNVYVQIDPTFAFTVANQSSACNGESNFLTAAGSPTAISLGHVSAGTNVAGGEALSVIGNSGDGFAVYVRGTQATTNLRSSGHNWSDVAGTYASPAVLGSGEVFGYTWLDSTASSSTPTAGSAKFAALDATNRAVMGSTSSTSGSGCVSFDAQSVAATPAGSYSGTVVYTAVPTF